MGCGCNNLPPELGFHRGMGTAGIPDPCDLPEYWVVQKGADGKCYNVCLAGDMAHEVDAQFCNGMTTTPTAGGGLGLNLSDNQILLFALGGVLLFALMTRN